MGNLTVSKMVKMFCRFSDKMMCKHRDTKEINPVTLVEL